MPDYLSCICRKSVSLQGMQFLFSWRVGGGCGTGSCPSQGNARLLAAATFMGVAVQAPVMQGSE